ncbi:MAG: nickel-responsive transcriptional regulator NikR [Bilophila sp.]
MGETVRFGVSLDADLLEKFDARCERQDCPSRSEALRDIIRDALVQDSLQSDEAEAAGVLTLIYDHHIRDLSRKLTERQHASHDVIVATLHVHLDHHNCLETLVLKGKAGQLRALADQLRSIRGVTHGTFSITAIGADLP